MIPSLDVARSSASADLPLAVGPAIRIAFLMRPLASLFSGRSMSLVVTLIASPKHRTLGHDLALKAASAIGATDIAWLADDVACDLFPQVGETPAGLAQRLQQAIAGAPVDVVIQQSATRRKKILVADMDSTMIDQECIDELADEVGLKERVAAITARSMNGEIAFEPALRERVALLKGLPAAVVDKLLATRITPTPGGRTLVATMRANGAWTCLVSGGFTLFTQPIAKTIGFDEQRANILSLAADNTFAGSVGEPILGREAKLATLLELAARQGVPLEESMAIGDGANDLAMIGAAGLGVAYHAKPAVAAAAHARIEYNDLTALLYVQGYRRDEFVLS